ncbi:MAG TPA: hypothetical protein DGG94_09435 [Micromonosporaceae bacterium]|nr:hypothetical protein [Micromonosporaceae bacterium]HCU50005.1 hypothetical protein [Micromonosporaceae bacterium]
MNRPFKRLLALAGSATLGLFGAVALASPAQAHWPIVGGTAICQADGQYKITWTVGNGNWGGGRIEKIDKLIATPSTPLTGLAVGDEIAPDGSKQGTQMVPGTTTKATLYVNAKWFNPDGTDPKWEEDATGEVKTDGKCVSEPEPSATFVSKCDGTVNVHLVNPGKDEITFTIKGTGYSKDVKVAAGGQADESVPGSAGALTVSVGGDEVGKFAGWVRPEECAKPSVLGESNCDKFTLKLTNPQGGQSADAKVVYGSQVKELTIAPGKTETVELIPSSETEAVVEYSGWGRQVIKYEKPANCPGLPQTGDNVGGYLASGAGLIGLGAVVFFLARRRMMQLRRMAS